MFKPDTDPAEIKRYLPAMSLDEMEGLLKQVNNQLRVETDPHKLMRLLDNKSILEKAIDTYDLTV